MYDELAEYYHLRYADWDASIKRQADALAALLPAGGRVLDCSCGVGTQTLGLAARGFQMTGSDLSGPMIARARRETSARGLAVDFHQADMRDLSVIPGLFDAVLSADNALPHLMTDEDLVAALRSIRAKLGPGGSLVASIRHYDRLRVERPTVEPPRFFQTPDGERRFCHQVWEWLGEDRYQLHMYMTVREDDAWRNLHFVSLYRALLRSEMEAALGAAGFTRWEWREAEETGFYQPIVLAF